MRSADDKRDLPHFLRVVRSIANVRTPAVSLAAVFTTVVAGAYCGCSDGLSVTASGGAPTTGTGGRTTTTSTELGTVTIPTTSTELGLGTMTTTTTIEMGVTVMPHDAGDDASDAGKHLGVVIMPDGGDGG
jgi:hypothetical protein